MGGDAKCTAGYAFAELEEGAGQRRSPCAREAGNSRAPKGGLWTVAAMSGSSLEKQNLWSHPRPTESETLSGRLGVCVSTRPPGDSDAQEGSSFAAHKNRSGSFQNPQRPSHTVTSESLGPGSR